MPVRAYPDPTPGSFDAKRKLLQSAINGKLAPHATCQLNNLPGNETRRCSITCNAAHLKVIVVRVPITSGRARVLPIRAVCDDNTGNASCRHCLRDCQMKQQCKNVHHSSQFLQNSGKNRRAFSNPVMIGFALLLVLCGKWLPVSSILKCLTQILHWVIVRRQHRPVKAHSTVVQTVQMSEVKRRLQTIQAA
jgi:hypothetical protein